MIVLLTYVVACYTLKITIGGIRMITNEIIKKVFQKVEEDEEPVIITMEEWKEIKEEIKEIKEFRNKMTIEHK